MADENTTPEGEEPKKRGPGRPPKPKLGVKPGETPALADQVRMARETSKRLDLVGQPRIRRRASGTRIIPQK